MVTTLLMAAAIIGVPDYAPLILLVVPMVIASLTMGLVIWLSRPQVRQTQ